MANISHRVTYAFDKKTVSRTPQEAFRILRQEQPLTPGTGMKWMQEIMKEREQDSLR